MKAWCPKCGSSAKFVSQTPRTIDFTDVTFRCENPKCGSDVLAEVKFGIRKVPDANCFSNGASLPVAGHVKTDC